MGLTTAETVGREVQQKLSIMPPMACAIELCRLPLFAMSNGLPRPSATAAGALEIFTAVGTRRVGATRTVPARLEGYGRLDPDGSCWMELFERDEPGRAGVHQTR